MKKILFGFALLNSMSSFAIETCQIKVMNTNRIIYETCSHQCDGKEFVYRDLGSSVILKPRLEEGFKIKHVVRDNDSDLYVLIKN